MGYVSILVLVAVICVIMSIATYRLKNSFPFDYSFKLSLLDYHFREDVYVKVWHIIIYFCIAVISICATLIGIELNYLRF